MNMEKLQQGKIELPKKIADLIADEDYSLDDIGKSGSTVMMFADKVLKVQPETDETKSEREMLKWLEGKLPVPRILGGCCRQMAGHCYLLSQPETQFLR